jgi:hypothetical protein
VRSTRHPANRPLLITEAPVNVDDEFDHRRKRYLLMMTIRALCIVGAATTFNFSGWLAAAFVVAAAALPWAAVLIANDRPPKQEMRFRRFVGADVGPHPDELTGRVDGDSTEQAMPGEHDEPRRNPFIIDL